jgi:Family of unknown function (DUF5691)
VSAWQELITAALMGTERASVPVTVVPGLPLPADASDIPFPNNPADPGNPGKPVQESPVPADPAALLLDRAALLTVARRGGRPVDRAAPPPVPEPDPAPGVSPAAARRLACILRGDHPDLLTEWLAAAVTRGRRAPAHLLPALLDRARRATPADPELRRLAAEAGGSRARWLAALNPDWKFVTAHALADEDTWRLGDAGQRRGYLTALRARDPGAARELIAGGWAAAGPDERAMFVTVLAAGLSQADEPLLDIALDHGNPRARTLAAEMLAALPGSALARRMARHALRCLTLHRGSRGTRLVVVPPAQCDIAMRRDGIPSGSSARSTHLAGQAGLVLEVLARTPLRTWTTEFGRPPEQILALPAGGWAPVLFDSWALAALAQRDREWMAALISRALAGGRPGTLSATQTLGQLARRADPALGAPGALPEPPPGAWPAAEDAVRVLRFRYQMLKELDDDCAG